MPDLGPRGPITDPNLRYPSTDRPDPYAADLKPFKPYVYRGQGYDIYEDVDEPEEDEGAPAWGYLDRSLARLAADGWRL